MRRIGAADEEFQAFNTCRHRGRTLRFSQSRGKLVVTELALGEEIRSVRVETGVGCRATGDRDISCCLFGGRILVMSGEWGNVSAALVDVDDGRLARETVRATSLVVAGERKWLGTPHLCQVSESRLLMYFDARHALWYCDVAGGTVTLRQLEAKMSTTHGFSTLPLRLPDGRLFVVEADPCSASIALVACDGEPAFERVGSIPGEVVCSTTPVLVGGRFVVVFRGTSSPDDLWLFDLRTRRSSIVWERGEWAPPANRPVLVLQGGTLYVIGREVHAIALWALSELIDDDEVRDAFCDTLGFPRVPRYTPPPADLGPPDRVQETGFRLPWPSYDTLQHGGRILHVSSANGELLVSELVLHGGHMNLFIAQTGVAFGEYVSCCALGNRVLVVSRENRAVSAALVTVGEGPLSERTVHATPLAVRGRVGRGHASYLCPLSETRALLYFGGWGEAWYCDLRGRRLALRKLGAEMPADRRLDCLPIRLSETTLLVAGSCPESTDITMITCGREPRFERVGGIPGMPRWGPSLILLGERFVLGFGGRCSDCLSDIWLFDLLTRRSSIVWEAEEWVEGRSNAALFLRDGRLLVMGGKVTAVPLRLVAERIDDDEIRGAFCEALDLPPAPKYSPPPPEIPASLEACRIRGSAIARVYNTVQHRGRIFHFFVDHGELTVSELVFYGRRVKTLVARTGLRVAGEELGCCSFGGRVLVISGGLCDGESPGSGSFPSRAFGRLLRAKGAQDAVSAALVEVGEGRLSGETVHVTPLAVSGATCWRRHPFLCQVAENRALLYFAGRREVWFCDLADEEVRVETAGAQMPRTLEPHALPLLLPDGKVLMVGSLGVSNGITLMSGDQHLRFEKVADVRWVGRFTSSAVLVEKRFLVGFSGCSESRLYHLWVFDIRTRRSSYVQRKGGCHVADRWTFLAVRGNALYLLGGREVLRADCISLPALAGGIQDERVRSRFSLRLGLPIVPERCFTRRALRLYTAPCL